MIGLTSANIPEDVIVRNWPSHSAKSDGWKERCSPWDWLLDADMQSRANTRLNKGEAQHTLKNGLRIYRWMKGLQKSRPNRGHGRARALLYPQLESRLQNIRCRNRSEITSRPVSTVPPANDHDKVFKTYTFL